MAAVLQYNLAFYMQYLVRWPEYFEVAVVNIMGFASTGMISDAVILLNQKSVNLNAQHAHLLGLML